MSGYHTPKSVLSSSSGSQSSYRRLDSNTTPSPSGGNTSPVFNPRVLSNKLAMIQASQALAQASATLSIAAKAMSKAAASLAAVSGYDDDDCTLGVPSSKDFKDWTRSPDWVQSSYNLPLAATASNGNEMYVVDEGYKLPKTEEIVPIADNPKPAQQARPSQSELTAGMQSPTLAPLTKARLSAPQVAIAQVLPVVPPSLCPPGTSGGIVNSVVEPNLPAISVKSVKDSRSKGDTATGSQSCERASKTLDTTPEPAPAPRLAPVTNTPCVPVKDCHGATSSKPLSQSTSTNTKRNRSQAPVATGSSPGPTRIILERGFDLLPALCHATKRCAKTVCLYNHSGLPATISAGVMLRANTKLPVIVPESTRQEKLAAAANKFNSIQSGVLLWPGCIMLPKTIVLANLQNMQLIQLGPPIQTDTSITTCSTTTLILAKSEFTEPQVGSTKDYSVDTLSKVCNQQGAKSPLEPFRLWLRSRLSDNSYARGFYWGWFLQHRRRNPKQNVVDPLKLANQYAEQFLLRGESKIHWEPVGGKITVTKGMVKDQKLEAAVQMGILLVA